MSSNARIATLSESPLPSSADSKLVHQMGSLSNRGLLVNDFFDVALYARSRVVSAVGMAPPHDVGVRGVRPPTSCAV